MMNGAKNNGIGKIIDELLLLGEDAEELKFWKNIFEDLAPEEQEKLRMNLEEELKELQKLRKL
ncbi:MAG: hypothetical protein A2847_00255 [Candidatus Sungbacteria bacterium RIFCSPHIGHO2_01_FULL_50_25]|uniref:Uncharacterized protein n=1 Tax=Candidatus Sungbacteria bacterium RIFCSPHIGHO2_01_FULL_50_25 TaxID=1802265 RepID=A0A1G2KAL3_9BACT|nr:MAG: hypothetical protein A2847_00255 [Candidatus Sungbacteria bacterium RIFCSPHIGHO2_01_FULL_50_25]